MHGRLGAFVKIALVKMISVFKTWQYARPCCRYDVTDVKCKERCLMLGKRSVITNMSRVSDPVFLRGSESGFQISLDKDPDPVFKFLLIRIRFSNFSGSASGFQILWIRIRPRIPEQKKSAERALKVIY